MPRRQLVVPKREDALAFARGASLLANEQTSNLANDQDRTLETKRTRTIESENDRKLNAEQTSKRANEPIFARVSPDVYEGLMTAVAMGKAKKNGPRKLQTLVDEALREWLMKRGFLPQEGS